MIEEDFVGYNEIPGLELQSQMQFDEPIYYTFYQDDLEQYLAASKRTVYIFKGMLINSISSPEDITGKIRS
jgi:lipopolysaccharide export system protein LptC